QPYDPREPFRSRFVPAGRNPQPRDLYDAEVAYMDQEVGRLLRELERSSELRSTLVIIVGDHGEHFGERGLNGHYNSVYMPLLHVPLILRLDGRLPAGHHVAESVSLRDLAATIMDIAGYGATSPFPGHSLAARWSAASVAGATEGSPSIATWGVSLSESLKSWRLDAGLFSLVAGDVHYVATGPKWIEELFRY